VLLGAAAAAMIGITSDRSEPVSLCGSSSGRKRRAKPSLSSHAAMCAARCSAARFQQRVCQSALPLEVRASRNAMGTLHHSQLRGMSGCLRRKDPAHLRSRRNPRRQRQDLAFGGADPAAVQRSIGAVRHQDQMVGAESLAASVAVKLVAAGAQHLAAGGIHARADFEERVSTVFVVLNRKALENRVARGAGGGSELRFHISIMLDPHKQVKENRQEIFKGVKLSLVAKKTRLPEEVLQFFREQGKRGGKIGGKARAQSLTSEERSAIAKKAAAARWGKKAE
jgi:hypothetical protein